MAGTWLGLRSEHFFGPKFLVVTFRAKEQVLVRLGDDEGGLLRVMGQEDAVVWQHSRQLGGERTSLSNDIDPPVNILLEPKQETTDFMLAKTYKLLILRIMTTKVKSMDRKYLPTCSGQRLSTN